MGIIDIALVPSGPIFYDLVTIIRDDSTSFNGSSINIAEYRKFLPHHLGIVFLGYRHFNLEIGDWRLHGSFGAIEKHSGVYFQDLYGPVHMQ